VVRPEPKRPLSLCMCIREDNIKMYSVQIGLEVLYGHVPVRIYECDNASLGSTNDQKLVSFRTISSPRRTLMLVYKAPNLFP
jgi:hypothetical protein